MEVVEEHKLLVDLDLGITEMRKTYNDDEICVDPAMGWLIKLAVHANQSIIRFERIVTGMMDRVEDMEDDDEEDKKGDLANMKNRLELLGEYNESLRRTVCDTKEAASGAT